MSLKRTSTADRSISPPPTKRRLVSDAVASNGIDKAQFDLKAQVKLSKAAADFFKPASRKAPNPCRWRTVDDSLLVCEYDKPDEHVSLRPRKVAAFDLDDTVITTSSGKKHSKEAHDWRFWHNRVVPTLTRLVNEGYLLVIISNQGGLGLDPASKTAKQDRARVVVFKEKVNAVLRALDLPVSLYAATKHDLYRKPRTGMWDALLLDKNLGAEDVDLEGSFFVGDAAGRIAEGKWHKDFSCSDRDLAANIGINFFTPDEYFLDEPPRTFVRLWNPKDFLSISANVKATEPLVYNKRNDTDIVLFVGSPGAGKSSFYWKYLEPLGYQRVNQDILKTRDKCLAVAADHLASSKSVCVDATNADIDVRSHWVRLAQKFSVPIRVVHFTAPARLCEHNDAVRALGRAWLARTSEDATAINPEDRTILPRMAFSGFTKRFVEPKLTEGFQDITQVPFEFSGDEIAKRVWSRYWLST